MSSADFIVTSQPAATGLVRLFDEQFTGFTAAGFAPSPAAGQLDSDIWRVVGLSDAPNPVYGGSYTSGDFARGVITGSADPFTAGVYAPSANPALVVQPTGAEIDVGGYVEARIVNTAGAAVTRFDIGYDWTSRNSGDRTSALDLFWSVDGISFNRVAAASFATPQARVGTAVPAAFATQAQTVSLTDLVVADGGTLFLRWQHTASSGSGNRDEVGIDNVTVDATTSAIVTARVDAVSVTEGNAGSTTALFTITRSSAIGTASVAYATADGTAAAGSDYVATSGTVSFADGETQRSVAVQVGADTVFEPNETFFLSLSDAQNLVVPVARAAATIVNDDSGAISIMQIQGESHFSAYSGLVATTSGIVTAVDANGFYLQDAVGDGNARTSDGLFVFTGTTPTTAVGDAVSVTGTVTEFGSQLPVTELTNASVTLLSRDNALPASVLIGTGGLLPPSETIDDDRLQSFDPASDGADFWESLEGMRVTLDAPRAVSSTSDNAFRETDVVVSGGLGATGNNDRGGITISPTDNSASPVDYNPERIQIDGSHTALLPGFAPAFSVGDVLASVTGVVNYAAARYEVLPTEAVTVTSDVTLARETTALVGDTTRLSLVTYNMENLDASDGKYAILASDIVANLRAPDIIAAQEIQDADGAGTGANLSGVPTAQGLIDALAALGKTYGYVEVAPTTANSTGGEPGGNIRNGYFYNMDRVSYVAGSAALITGTAYEGTRRPLVAEWQFNGETLVTINVHATSRLGSDPLYGLDQPPTDAGQAQRTAQAAGIKAYVNERLATDPGLNIAALGDWNGFYFEVEQRQLTEAAQGGVFTNLATVHLPEEERYSFLFEGNNQLLDNVLVTGGLVAGSAYDAVHLNSQVTGARPTDHDPQLALLRLGADDRARDDFNGDGRSDILWRNDDGRLSDWLGTATGGFVANDANALVPVTTDWKVAGTGDFNGDGRNDILWRNDNGALSDWLGTASGGFMLNDANALVPETTDWKVAGTGDFNGDGRDDILWRNDTGALSDWLGTAAGGFVINDVNALVSVTTDWKVAGTGDFNGDGRADILWRNDNGALSNWLGTATGGFVVNDANALVPVTTDWKVAGTGDFNGDGRDDILWRNDNGTLSNWLGTATGGFVVNDANALVPVTTDWKVAGTGDFNGDRRDDILWRNDDGRLSDWLGTASGGFVPNDANALQPVDPLWKVQADPGLFI